MTMKRDEMPASLRKREGKGETRIQDSVARRHFSTGLSMESFGRGIFSLPRQWFGFLGASMPRAALVLAPHPDRRAFPATPMHPHQRSSAPPGGGAP